MLTQCYPCDGVTNVMLNFWHEFSGDGVTIVVSNFGKSSWYFNHHHYPALLGGTRQETLRRRKKHPYPSIVFSYHVLLSTIFVPSLNKLSWVVSFALAGRSSALLHLCVVHLGEPGCC